MTQKMTDEKILLLQSNNHKTVKELVILLSISPRTIAAWRKNLKLIAPYKLKGSRLKHTEREDINDFDLGWCIGLFAADGCLTKNRQNRSPINRIFLTLGIDDREMLEIFFTTLVTDFNKTDVKIIPPSIGQKDKAKYCATLPLFETRIKQILQFNKKTYDMSIIHNEFDKKSPSFKIGFLRGVIDGDGHVSKSGKMISIVSASERFIDDIITFYGGRKRKRKIGKCWDVFFNKKDVERLKSMGLNPPAPSVTLDRKTTRLNINRKI